MVHLRFTVMVRLRFTVLLLVLLFSWIAVVLACNDVIISSIDDQFSEKMKEHVISGDTKMFDVSENKVLIVKRRSFKVKDAVITGNDVKPSNKLVNSPNTERLALAIAEMYKMMKKDYRQSRHMPPINNKDQDEYTAP